MRSSSVTVWSRIRHLRCKRKRRVVMNRGRIVYDGDSAALKADSDRLAGLMGWG